MTWLINAYHMSRASESVIKPCIKNDRLIKYANYVVTICVDIHKNVAFSNGEIVTF